MIKRENIEFKQESINNVKFESAILDIDYIGWKYNIPDDKKKIIVLNNFFQQVLPLTNHSELQEFYEKIQFQICNWKNFENSKIRTGYYQQILTFVPEINNQTIIEIVIKYVLELIENQESIIDEEEHDKYIIYLNKSRSNDIINYEQCIIIDDGSIYNIVPCCEGFNKYTG